MGPRSEGFLTLVRIVLFAALVALPLSSAQAEDPPGYSEEEAEEDSADERPMLDLDEAQDQAVDIASRAFGIPEDSRFFKALKKEIGADVRDHYRKALKKRKHGMSIEEGEKDEEEQLAEARNAEQEELAMEIFPEVDENLPITKHYRGRYGIPLPAPDEVLNPFKLTKEEFKAKMEEYRPVIEQMVQNQLSTPKLPRCLESKTTKAKLDGGGDGLTKSEKKVVMFDMLFIEPADMPIDSQEAFGERTVVRQYEPDVKDPQALLVRNLGITCLPYRVRITQSYQFVDEGLNALKNYDKNHHGKGKLQDSMKKFTDSFDS